MSTDPSTTRTSTQPRPGNRRRSALLVAATAAVLIGGGSAAAFAADGSSAPAGPAAGAAAATPEKRPHAPHLDGTVKSVSGTTILITDHDGFTRTIVVSSSTTYSDGLTATPKTGTALHATGTVDADGTTLDATAVGARPAPPADGHGPGRGRAGGPGRGAPKPPTAAPSADPSASASTATPTAAPTGS